MGEGSLLYDGVRWGFSVQSSGTPTHSTYLFPPSSQPMSNTEYLVQVYWDLGESKNVGVSEARIEKQWGNEQNDWVTGQEIIL